MKIVWRVSDRPTGQYRAFEKRGWPMAFSDRNQTYPLAALYCEAEYTPDVVKTGEHDEIEIQVADHRNWPWKWRTLKKKAKTLVEAKQLVVDFYKAHVDWMPKTKPEGL